MNITVNGVQFQEVEDITPDCIAYKGKYYNKPSYKVGDWIIFNILDENKIRKIISDEEYIKERHSVHDKYGNWMTIGAVDEHLSYVKGKASTIEIIKHLKSLARSKGYKWNKIIYAPLFDTLSIDNKVIYDNGKWTTVFTFGGWDVSITKDTNIFIDLGGVKGSMIELDQVIKNFLHRIYFGYHMIQYVTFKNKSEVCTRYQPWEGVDKIKIGRIEGKMEELVKIYEYCLTL